MYNNSHTIGASGGNKTMLSIAPTMPSAPKSGNVLKLK